MFFRLLLPSFLYFRFYHLSSTLSLVHISMFLSLFIFSCVILLLICKVLVTLLKLALKMISKRRIIFSLVFMLKIFYSCCYCYCYFEPREFTGDPRHSPIRLSRPKKKKKKHPRPAKKFSTCQKKFSTHENKSRKINVNSQRVDLHLAWWNDIWAWYPKNNIDHFCPQRLSTVQPSIMFYRYHAFLATLIQFVETETVIFVSLERRLIQSVFHWTFLS